MTAPTIMAPKEDGASHTPGPWEAVPEAAADVDHYLHSIYGVDEFGGGGLLIARCDQRGEHAADAHLIAAAPDMLAALQMMVAHSDKLIADGSYDYRKPRVQELYDMCAAAIARAEGRS